jgi:hypothetical protein
MSYPNVALDTLVVGQSGKETTANDMFEAASPAVLFGCKPEDTSGLTFGYYGGVMFVDGVVTAIANGTVGLTLSTTNYVEATRAGVVSANTTGFTAGRIPLYTFVTGASTITSATPARAWVTPNYLTQESSFSVTSADVTLTASQARSDILTTTGVLTGNRSVIVPNSGKWWCFCNNTGAFTTTFKTSAGTGIVVAQGKVAMLWANGTNVVRLTDDTA